MMMDWQEFWEYLEYHAAEHDAYWLGEWLEAALHDYVNTEPCKECGSKFFHKSYKFSKDGNYILAQLTYCAKCKTISHIADYYRKELRKKVKKIDLEKMLKALKEPLPKVGMKYERG